jgi:hypothetical protein
VRRFVLSLTCLLAFGAPAAVQGAPPWPWTTLQLGLADEEGGAGALRASAPFGLRYHYLAGGINTPGPWQTWARGDGTFVTDFIEDSADYGVTPVFSYYELRQSLPGAGQSDEQRAVIGNLGDARTMRAWFEDLKVFFERANATGQTVVLQVEPDLWGYVQQAGGDDAADVPAQVASTGMLDLRALPNTAAGVARGVVRLRDTYAPRVLLGYPVSIWGTGKDIAHSDEGDESVDVLADRSVRFARSLHAGFDVVFAELADRDAGYATQRGSTTAWWDASDFRRHARFLADVHARLKRPVVLWQIPLGNTLFRAMDDTPHHYQDNRVQWLLGSDAKTHLGQYLNAGVVALLFGAGQADGTCACDAARDGVTDPAPTGTNTRASLSADDDGGYFRARAAAYYAAGALPLPLPASTRPPKRHGKAGPAKLHHPGRFSTRARVSRATVRRGGTVRITASVRPTRSQTALFSIEVYRGTKQVFHRTFDQTALRRGRVRTYTARWAVPADATPGEYAVALGVFGPGFEGLRSWNDRAARVRVR